MLYDYLRQFVKSAGVVLKDDRAKSFQSIDFFNFKFLRQSDNELPVSEMK